MGRGRKLTGWRIALNNPQDVTLKKEKNPGLYLLVESVALNRSVMMQIRRTTL